MCSIGVVGLQPKFHELYSSYCELCGCSSTNFLVIIKKFIIMAHQPSQDEKKEIYLEWS